MNRSTGRGRGFISRSIVENNSNLSLLWDGIDLPIPDNSNPANSQPDGSETFRIDSFLEDNNQFIAGANELLKHYEEQVNREREKLIKELEEKSRTKRRNETTRH